MRDTVQTVATAFAAVFVIAPAVTLLAAWPAMVLIGVLSRPIPAVPPLGLWHTAALILALHLILPGSDRSTSNK